jgi:hypothetical protein
MADPAHHAAIVIMLARRRKRGIDGFPALAMP